MVPTLSFLYWALPLTASIFLIYWLKTPADTWLTVFGTYFTVIPVIISVALLLFRKKFARSVERVKKRYLAARIVRIKRARPRAEFTFE
jgi:fructose-specific phosphotransferase system IIC component